MLFSHLAYFSLLQLADFEEVFFFTFVVLTSMLPPISYNQTRFSRLIPVKHTGNHKFKWGGYQHRLSAQIIRTGYQHRLSAQIISLPTQLPT
jgi:hypothetical protein